ncbi:LysR family transcriptional regulator [Phyllobacterium sp. YR531]|uniref:LysR family transcriptional regulator n=1 Tax=Phyllobacterium sp. YR531 TaxID=1144343 RepID=UPI00026F5207|nr:LysR family transcriptional regulator [Phyllobacterium sp. YR531]EJN06532.1 transcriptional regulator [Phyllobacterium sp. YR531]
MTSDFQELNAVVALATHRNFRIAASNLGMSPSAFSRAIGALEERMGVRLFHRTTRSVSLSEAGEQFLARVQPALREISDAMDAANIFRDTPRGTLRINMSEPAARQIFHPLILEYLKRYPDMSVDLVAEGRLVDIVSGGFDAGIRLAETVPQDMIAVSIDQGQRMVVMGSPEYFQRNGMPKSPSDLLRHECIRLRLPSGKIYRWSFTKNGEEIVLDVNGRLTLDAPSLIVDAALAGVGLGHLNRWSVQDHLREGQLVEVLEDWLPPFPGLQLYYPGHRHISAGLRAFIDLVREVNSPARRHKREP